MPVHGPDQHGRDEYPDLIMVPALDERAVDYAIEYRVTILFRRAHGAADESVDHAEPATAPARIVGAACDDERLQTGFDTDTDHTNLSGQLDYLNAFLPERTGGPSESDRIQLLDDQGLARLFRKEFTSSVSVFGPTPGASAVGCRAGIAAWAERMARKGHEAAGISVHNEYVSTRTVTGPVDTRHVAREREHALPSI